MDEGFSVIYQETESVSGNRGYKSGKGLRPTPGITPLNCDRELGSRSPTDSRCGLPSQEVDMVSDVESAYYRFSIKEEVYSCSSYFFTLVSYGQTNQDSYTRGSQQLLVRQDADASDVSHLHGSRTISRFGISRCCMISVLAIYDKILRIYVRVLDKEPFLPA